MCNILQTNKIKEPIFYKSECIEFAELLLDLVDVLVDHFNLEFKLLLPLDLHLVLGCAQLAILILHSLLVDLHRRKSILQMVRLLPDRLLSGCEGRSISIGFLPSRFLREGKLAGGRLLHGSWREVLV